MRSLIVVAGCLVGAFVFGCGDASPGPALSISPSGTSGTIEIAGPTGFSAVLVNSTADVSWTATGGTISSTAGLHVVYTPPLGSGTGSVTATAAGMTAVVQITSKPATLTGKIIPGLTQPVTVQYDAQDIPHIKCAKTNDCLAVQGYLQARDRLFPMDFLRHVAESRLTEMIGPDGLDQDVKLRTLFVTRAGERLEVALARVMDPAVKPLVQAFADGINAYIKELRTAHGALPGEYAQLPFRLTADDIDLWTIEDTMALSRLQQFQLSETLTQETDFGTFAMTYPPAVLGGNAVQDAKFNAWIRAEAPPTERAHTLAATVFQPPVPLARKSLPPSAKLAKWKDMLAATATSLRSLRQVLRPADATVGSNNWVVAADKSATHVAMVANDPHLSLQYPPLFHLAVMTSTNPSDNLDLTGGSFPGIPGALVGRGAHVGWGVTVVGYDVTDVYTEKIIACGNANPTPCVDFKGPVPTIPVQQNFRIRTGPGPIASSSTVTPMLGLVVPHHGPIVKLDAKAGTAVSVRWTGHEGNTQDVKAFLGLNTAANVDAAMTALKDFATGAQNFVLADDAGHIAYDPHALVPVRRFADPLIVGANLQPPWFPLHGETGTAEWGTDPTVCATATDTPVPAACWIADDLLPHGKDPVKGYFFTANADPIGVSDGNNPLLPANQPYLSFAWDDSTGFRATRIDQMLDAAIKAHGNVTLDDMKAIQSDHVSRPGMVFTAIIDQIITNLSAGDKSAELLAAQAVLDQWATNGSDCPSGLLGSDPKNSPIDPTPAVVQNSSGCFLFHEFLRVLLTSVFTDDLKAAGQGVNGLQALKAMIFLLGQPDGPDATEFCNDHDATGKPIVHTCRQQVVIALVQAFKTLSAQVGPKPSDWVWGRVHTIKPVSLLALVTNDFEPGPYARPGGAFTVDVGSPSLSSGGLDFPYGSGGNVRHISLMDPAKPVVKMQLPGPERDGPATVIGPDLLGQWVKNAYFDYAVSSQIDGVAVSTQTFSAQ